MLDVIPFPVAEPAIAKLLIDGQLFRVSLWQPDDWDRLPRHARPTGTIRASDGQRFTIRPEPAQAHA